MFPILVVLLWIAIGTSAQQPPGELVVASSPLVVAGPNGLTVAEFDVTNKTGQAVTAWDVLVEATLSNGTLSARGTAPDGYGAYAGVYPDNNVFIRPHASVRRQVLLSVPTGVTVVGVRAVLRCAIFADGSWIGDAERARSVFTQRERDRDTYGFIAAALRAGYAAGAGPDGLKVALDRLSTKDQEDYGNPLKEVMRQNLQRALERKAQGSPNELLRILVLQTEANWVAADASRRPKPSGPEK
jgi:hypothetical protein